jgi:DNA-binding transcriptional regulator YbjK
MREMFSTQQQIELLQGLYLTYQKEGATKELLQMTMNRLKQLQEIAK